MPAEKAAALFVMIACASCLTVIVGPTAPVHRASAMPAGTPVFLDGDSTMMAMEYADFGGGFTTDARNIVAASFPLTFDAMSCRRV